MQVSIKVPDTSGQLERALERAFSKPLKVSGQDKILSELKAIRQAIEGQSKQIQKINSPTVKLPPKLNDTLDKLVAALMKGRSRTFGSNY